MNSPSPDPLQQIPGIGPRIAQQLNQIGIHTPADLKRRTPESLYRRLCDYHAAPVDRCLLYVLRCAAYYLNHSHHDPNLLLWWNWKNRP